MKIANKFIIIIFLSLYSLNKSFSNDFTKQLEYLFKSPLIDPSGLFFDLLLGKFKSNDDNFSCSLCKNVVTAVRKTIEEKFGPDKARYYIETLCLIALDKDVCEGAMKNYFPTMYTGLLKRIANSENLCYSLNYCAEGEETEDVYDIAVRLLKDKPKDKKREPIDKTAPTLKMLQITDIHLDLNYTEGASVYCGKPICCRQEASQYARKKSGKYGYVANCDLSEEVFDSFLDDAYEQKPDFIIWTGDNTPHDIWDSGQESVYNYTKYIKMKIDAKFGNIPVFPSLGDIEKFPNAQYNIKDEHEFLENMAEIYKDYFTEQQAYETFKQFGYYTQKYKDTNLRIIAINPFLCDNINFYLIAGEYEATRAEFEWLENVLREAEKNNEYIYILDHFPINSNFQLNECSKRFIALFDRFDYIIRGYFSGHTHYNDIAPIRTYFEPKPIININYIAPGLTTYPSRNPSYRIYILDSNTKNIIDYEQYRLNITKANIEGKITWELKYNATEFFNVTDLTEIEKMCSINVSEGYINERYTDGLGDLNNNKKEIKEAQCQITTDTYHDFYVCVADSIFSRYYLIEALNNLAGEWALNNK